MRILMLGWEFPPYITGGLGTACYGLTRAMSDRGDIDITFVLPKSVGGEYTQHVKLLTPQIASAAAGDRAPQAVASTFQAAPPSPARQQAAAPSPGAMPNNADDPADQGTAFRNVVFKAVPAHMASVYPAGGLQFSGRGHTQTNPGGIGFIHSKPPLHDSPEPSAPSPSTDSTTQHQNHAQDQAQTLPDSPDIGYGGDLFVEAQRYADLCLDLAKDQPFDLIHAHDWLTFPAAEALAQATGKPWIAHVHSTEYDRAGDGANLEIVGYERRGIHAADRVIAVSAFTKHLLASRYDMPADRCEVVYNGVERTVDPDTQRTEPVAPPTGIRKDEKVVLYLGRVTMQKGPEYFIAAAKKVLEKLDNVKFVVAGSGDQIEQTIEQAARAGIGSKVTFTGFLHKQDVKRVYDMADVYVMPSVSEPFGIAPLEAIAHDTPVIISRQSGVSEVLEHALKVDFWDTHDIADKIIAVLRHPPLSATLREHADLEVRELTWHGAAERCQQIYADLASA